MSDGVAFRCCECGADVLRAVGPLPDPLLCAACVHLPGWYHDPKLRETLECDPGERERLKALAEAEA